MPIPILTVDAFTGQAFRGNPAAVCLLDRPGDAAWMQQVAGEMNLSETAFVVPGDGAFGLRWFTPTVEVALCGHATLAAAHVLWQTGRVARATSIAFDTLSGRLGATADGERVAIELPAIPVTDCQVPPALAAALGAAPDAWLTTTPDGKRHGNYLAVFASEEQVRALNPDFAALRGIPAGVIVTAPASRPSCDFVSRYFAAPYGIDEDPVTGSAHCSLTPYWAHRLGRDELRAFQASKRGGELHVSLQGDRVRLSGHAVTVMKGELIP
jgi:PhzF family phenazine biosynthesis protein